MKRAKGKSIIAGSVMVVSLLFLLSLVIALPPMSYAETKIRMQSAFPAKGTFADNAVFFAERVKAMSGGRIQIELIPTGAIVPAYEVLDAVHKKVLDAAHSSPAYWVGKNRAAALFGVSPSGPFGMDAFDYMGWVHEGGGMALYNELYNDVLKQNVIPLPMTSAGPQALGWFKKPVNSWADLKGRKCRQTGISAEVYAKGGMMTVNIPGGEILAAGERGVIDCAEWVGPADDEIMGFQTVWKHFYTQSFHDLSVLEIIINGDVWKSLTPDLQAIIQSATVEATLRSFNRRNRLNAGALQEMTTKQGVIVHATPDDILKKSLESWDQIAKEEAAKNPFFRKVYDSQRAYAAQVVPSRRTTSPAYNFSADYYWPRPKQK
jgi:TRAP-type mannitol/chloroaromatic compound transport system substrate-binding protein